MFDINEITSKIEAAGYETSLNTVVDQYDSRDKVD